MGDHRHTSWSVERAPGMCLIEFTFTFSTSGLISSFAGLVVARAFLGLAEGPMFPGIVLYLSGFYTREELSLRYECWVVNIWAY